MFGGVQRWLAVSLLFLSCDAVRDRPAPRAELPLPPPPQPASASAPSAASAAAPPPAPPPAPVQVEAVDLASGRKTFVLRGARGNDRIVFLHGLCGHGLGYLQSFQFAAAKHGMAIAPHGDLACNGPWRSWSIDLVAIEQQIEDSFAVLGEAEPRAMTLIGYSLGATRAEALARKYPDRYDALVLIAAPTAPQPSKLSGLRAAAMMAGSRDRQELMKSAVKRYTRAGIASRFFVLPGAAHGEMGPEAERVMDEVLAWVDAQPHRDGG
jgi:predicted esterase